MFAEIRPAAPQIVKLRDPPSWDQFTIKVCELYVCASVALMILTVSSPGLGTDKI